MLVSARRASIPESDRQAFPQAGKEIGCMFQTNGDINLEKIKHSKYFRSLFPESHEGTAYGLRKEPDKQDGMRTSKTLVQAKQTSLYGDGCKESDQNSMKDNFMKENVIFKGFEPLKILAKIRKDAAEDGVSVSLPNVTRFWYKKPKLALVFADLLVDPHLNVATALREIGYEIEVFSLEDGPMRVTWREVGLPLNVITADENMKFSVNWLNYHGIVVNSLGAVGVLASLLQEPFRSVPVVWTIHEQTLAIRLRQYVSSGRTKMVDSWKKDKFYEDCVVIGKKYSSHNYRISLARRMFGGTLSSKVKCFSCHKNSAPQSLVYEMEVDFRVYENHLEQALRRILCDISAECIHCETMNSCRAKIDQGLRVAIFVLADRSKKSTRWLSFPLILDLSPFAEHMSHYDLSAVSVHVQ